VYGYAPVRLRVLPRVWHAVHAVHAVGSDICRKRHAGRMHKAKTRAVCEIWNLLGQKTMDIVENPIISYNLSGIMHVVDLICCLQRPKWFNCRDSHQFGLFVGNGVYTCPDLLTLTPKWFNSSKPVLNVAGPQYGRPGSYRTPWVIYPTHPM
jgi:hypothetical protein